MTALRGAGGGLAQRDRKALELMDDPDCDPVALRRTYGQFRVVNRLVSGWRRIYVYRLRSLLSRDETTTLLDIGFGGGDVPRALARWARRDGLRLVVTAIDPDERAQAYVADLPPAPGVVFSRATSADLVAQRARFDLVVSNHVLHHLDDAELQGVLADSRRLARRLVVHSDLARSRFAYVGWSAVSRPFARRSFVHVDGLLSIRRSYRAAELAAAAGPAWRVESQFPSRLLLISELAADGSAVSR